MRHFTQRVIARKDETGASAVEYGLLVAAIAALIVLVVFGLGRVVSGVFSETCDAVATGAATSASCEAPAAEEGGEEG